MSFRDDYEYRLTIWTDVGYCMPRMYEEAASRPGVAILELGVRSGNSTAAFLAGLETSGGHLWSIDVNPPETAEHWLASPLWTFTLGDDLVVPLPVDAVDVLFIDTLHAYGHTLRELRRFVPLVKPGGTVLLHDTVYSEKWEDDKEDNPVARALDSFCGETGRSWVEHGGEFGFGEIARPNG